MSASGPQAVTVTFAGSGDAFGSGGRFQACIHIRCQNDTQPVLLDCGATSLSALKRCGIDPAEIGAVFVSHLHGDHFGGLPFLILDGQFARRTAVLTVVGPEGTARRLTAAMECLFPGSSTAARAFAVDVRELHQGQTITVAGVSARAWPADHPSGAPALALRLCLGGKVIGYTGDTAWTDALAEVAAGADLLIAEAYYWDKNVPFHLRHADLAAHREKLRSRRIVLTHLSADMLARLDEAGFEVASDGLVLHI
jgi:ribonuclease BN (tRNA processing enzyme)